MQKLSSRIVTLTASTFLSLLLGVEICRNHEQLAKYDMYLCVESILDKILRGRVICFQSALGPVASEHEYSGVIAKILEEWCCFRT